MRHSFSRFVVALTLSPLAVACGYGDHMHHDDGYSSGSTPPPSSGVIEQSTIDADQLLDVDPGAGAGAFIEYSSDGIYTITTSCDSGGSTSCLWDILVTPLDGAVASVAPNGLESDDSLTFGQGNSVNLIAYTGNDFDSFALTTDPGAAIEVDALLDDRPANRYMFWVGDGALHSGAPSNPIDLVPSK